MSAPQHDWEALRHDGVGLGRSHLDGYGACDCACERCWDGVRCLCVDCNPDTCREPRS